MIRAWSAPPAHLELPDDEVHVWLAPLDVGDDERAQLELMLNTEERERAARYLRPRDRDRCVARRGILRQLLARYLATDPRALRFATGAHGKPSLASVGAAAGLTFNLSDSDGVALYAVARDRSVGVDLERVDPRAARDEVAERFFSRREVDALRSLPAQQQGAAFFTCWTRKEAYIKAHGVGLSLPLDQFDVSLGPGERAALLATAWDPADTSRWSLTELPAIPGFAAALCAAGRDWRMRCWRLTPRWSGRPEHHGAGPAHASQGASGD
jgi:4'-phosphopantetheinyl transferase